MINMNFLFSRLCRICVPGVVYDGDVGEDVRVRTADLLRVIVQPVRLRGHLRLHL